MSRILTMKVENYNIYIIYKVCCSAYLNGRGGYIKVPTFQTFDLTVAVDVRSSASDSLLV